MYFDAVTGQGVPVEIEGFWPSSGFAGWYKGFMIVYF